METRFFPVGVKIPERLAVGFQGLWIGLCKQVCLKLSLNLKHVMREMKHPGRDQVTNWVVYWPGVVSNEHVLRDLRLFRSHRQNVSL